MIESSFSISQKEFKERNKRAKRLLEHLKEFIFSEVIESLSKYDKVKLTDLTRFYDEFKEVFNRAYNPDLFNSWEERLLSVIEFFKKRIINIFCFGSNSEIYKDVIRIIALYMKQKNII